MTAAREALAGRLRQAGLRPDAAHRVAGEVLGDPDIGPGGWVGPVELGPGVVLWVDVRGQAPPVRLASVGRRA